MEIGAANRPGQPKYGGDRRENDGGNGTPQPVSNETTAIIAKRRRKSQQQKWKLWKIFVELASGWLAPLFGLLISDGGGGGASMQKFLAAGQFAVKTKKKCVCVFCCGGAGA